MEDAQIRLIERSDVQQVTRLLDELGYPISEDALLEKINLLSVSNADSVYVATIREMVIGVISVHVIPLFHAIGNLARITSLVVTTRYQRAGVGRRLVEAAESFARKSNCIRVEVTSGSHREGAHAFYEGMGYEKSSHGRFLKNL